MPTVAFWQIYFFPRPLQFNESPETGKPILVIGSPEGFEFSLTSGIISAYREDKYGTIYLQTDAAINSGNSGGPLIDSDGKIVGIATWKLQGDGVENMGFAISIKSVMKLLDKNDLSFLIKKIENTDIEKLSSKESIPEISSKIEDKPKNIVDKKFRVKPDYKLIGFRFLFIISAIFGVYYSVNLFLRIKK